MWPCEQESLSSDVFFIALEPRATNLIALFWWLQCHTLRKTGTWAKTIMIPPKSPWLFLLGPGMGRCRHSSSKAVWPLCDWKQHLVSRLPAVFLLSRGSQLQTDVTFPQHVVLTSLTYTLFEQRAAKLLNTFKSEAIPTQDGRRAILCLDLSIERCRMSPGPMRITPLCFSSALYPVT